MRPSLLPLVGLLVLQAARVQAVDFSTSALRPTQLDPTGAIAASFPSGNGRTSYYFVADLQKGELLTQLSFKGHAGPEKHVEFTLLDENAHLVSSFWIRGIETKRDAVRSFPIEAAGQRMLRVTVFGPETDEFRIEVGGGAFPTITPPPAVKEEAPSAAPPAEKKPPPKKAPAAKKK